MKLFETLPLLALVLPLASTSIVAQQRLTTAPIHAQSVPDSLPAAPAVLSQVANASPTSAAVGVREAASPVGGQPDATDRPGIGPQSAAVVTYRNRPMKPTGASLSMVGSPSVANFKDGIFGTGHYYGSVSTDSGQSFRLSDPRRVLPASDGGTPIDQSVIYVPRSKAVLWILHYPYSSKTGTGRLRVAVFRNQAQLKSGRPNHYYDLLPRLHGRNGAFYYRWSNVSFSDRNVFISTDTLTPSGQFAGSTIYRIDSARLVGRTLTNVGYTAYPASAPRSPRLVSAKTSWMYWAAHVDTDTIRLSWVSDSSSSIGSRDINVPRWYSRGSSQMSAPTPDGKRWLGRLDHRMTAGWKSGNEVGFAWTSNRGGGYPLPHTRILRINTSDFRVNGHNVLWNPNYAWTHMTAAVNDRGHVAGTIYTGGPGTHIQASSWIVDNLNSWSRIDMGFVRRSTHGPYTNHFGDFTSVAAHSDSRNTWIASHMTMQGGNATTNLSTGFVWFGRDRDRPKTPTVTVRSGPIRGVKIDISERDLYNRLGGPTQLGRTFSQYQAYTLTAPRVVAGLVKHAFVRWISGSIVQPKGQTALRIAEQGTGNRSVTAIYAPVQVLRVRSWPIRVNVQLSTSDIHGNRNGATSLVREYPQHDKVTLTAPASVGGRKLAHFKVNGQVKGHLGGMIALTLDKHTTVEAIYGYYTAGKAAPFGQGCIGSNGKRATHSVTGHFILKPQIGFDATFAVGGARPAQTVQLTFGATKRVLPIPGTPCYFYNEMAVVLTMFTNAIGSAAVKTRIPNDSGLVGVTLFTQFICADPLAYSLGFTTSNGVETTIGGWQLR